MLKGRSPMNAQQEQFLWKPGSKILPEYLYLVTVAITCYRTIPGIVVTNFSWRFDQFVKNNLFLDLSIKCLWHVILNDLCMLHFLLTCEIMVDSRETIGSPRARCTKGEILKFDALTLSTSPGEHEKWLWMFAPLEAAPHILLALPSYSLIFYC